jgi:uncharacterized membrane protein YfcA
MLVLGLIILGTFIGFLSGLFGVGGGFLLVPMLNVIFGIPYNIAVGSSLAMILGTSISATIRHSRLDNVDYKLSLYMIGGRVVGVEIGARILQIFKGMGPIVVHDCQMAALDFYLPLAYIALLGSVGTIIFSESRAARKNNPGVGSVDNSFIRTIHNISFPPIVSLPKSGINKLSLWVVLALAVAVGLLAGFMGVGGGFILMPGLVYIIGIPTTIAIGTDLFQIMFSAGFGAFTHAIKGNVDGFLVITLLMGSIVGAQFGALATKKFPAAQIRYYFSIILYAADLVIAIKLLTQLGIL